MKRGRDIAPRPRWPWPCRRGARSRTSACRLSAPPCAAGTSPGSPVCRLRGSTAMRERRSPRGNSRVSGATSARILPRPRTHDTTASGIPSGRATPASSSAVAFARAIIHCTPRRDGHIKSHWWRRTPPFSLARLRGVFSRSDEKPREVENGGKGLEFFQEGTLLYAWIYRAFKF